MFVPMFQAVPHTTQPRTKGHFRVVSWLFVLVFLLFLWKFIMSACYTGKYKCKFVSWMSFICFWGLTCMIIMFFLFLQSMLLWYTMRSHGKDRGCEYTCGCNTSVLAFHDEMKRAWANPADIKTESIRESVCLRHFVNTHRSTVWAVWEKKVIYILPHDLEVIVMIRFCWPVD